MRHRTRRAFGENIDLVTRYSSRVAERTAPCSPPGWRRARSARSTLRGLGSAVATMPHARSGVVLTFPARQPAISSSAGVRVLGSGETTRVWDGSAEADFDDNTITSRFDGAAALFLWEREELQWFDAGEHLLEQASEEMAEALDPSAELAKPPARPALLHVLCASAVVAFALALLCISLAAH